MLLPGTTASKPEPSSHNVRPGEGLPNVLTTCKPQLVPCTVTIRASLVWLPTLTVTGPQTASVGTVAVREPGLAPVTIALVVPVAELNKTMFDVGSELKPIPVNVTLVPRLILKNGDTCIKASGGAIPLIVSGNAPPISGTSCRYTSIPPLTASGGVVTISVVAVASDAVTTVTPPPVVGNTTLLLAANVEKPVPVIVRTSPRFGVFGNSVLTEGVVRFAFAPTENTASARQSPMFALLDRFRSPTVSGNAGLFNPPTISAHSRASLMLTLRSALMSARSITFLPPGLDLPIDETSVSVTAPGTVNCAAGTIAVSCVVLTKLVFSAVAPHRNCVP